MRWQQALGRFVKPTLSFISRQSLPQIEGRMRVPGLRAPVTVKRDRWGNPTLYASDRADLFLAQGFTHAQDRFWQMEINRRAATGRLAELLGPQALDTDRLVRTLGLHRLAETTWSILPGDVQAAVARYAAGVNAWLDASRRLPVEFTLLRHRPEPWSPLDSVAYARLQLWALSNGWASELVRAQLIELVGPAAAAELEPRYPVRHPVTLPEGVRLTDLRLDPDWRQAAGPWLSRGSDAGAGGSNSWVLAGRHTRTGAPILANDMHLPVNTPSLWYYIHLQADDGFHVAGVSQPGLPYVLVGHNETIAWGATLAFTDVEDLVLERFATADRRDYQVENGWERTMKRRELIPVRGRPDHVETIFETRHGPIISSLLNVAPIPGSPGPPEGRAHYALALRSVALAPARQFAGFPRLNEAQDWEAFAAAARQIECPSLNLLYADRAGHIGHHVTGLVPIRRQGDGLTPVPGWTDAYDWAGNVPLVAMPQALDPVAGFIVSCNNRIVDDSYPYFLGNIWINGYRARRVEERLRALEKHDLDSCAAIQLDQLCQPGLALARRLAQLTPDNPEAAFALTLLRDWDGWLGPDSVGGAIYKVFLQRVAHILLEPHLGSAFLARFLGAGPHAQLVPVNEYHGYWSDTLLRLLDDPSSDWVAGRLGRDALLTRALADTAAELRERLGADPAQWRWGRLHQVRFPHHLGRQPVLAAIFDQGPFPVGGDTNTVCQTAIRPDAPYENNAMTVSFRQLIDLRDFDNSRAMLVPGQSGQLGSPHYGDLIEPWLTGQYFPMRWSRAAVDQGARHVLELVPDPISSGRAR